MNTSESQQTEVDSNYQVFLRDLPRLLRSSKGSYAVYRHRELIDIFQTSAAAVAFGNKTYGDRVFSVQEITEEPLDLGGLSYAENYPGESGPSGS